MTNIRNKILITGGSGFIGSALTSKLSGHKNNEIYVLDIEEPKTNLDIKYKKIDIRSDKIKDYFQEIKPDKIIHLAAQASVAISSKDPVLDNDVNVGGSLNILKSALELKLTQFVFFSTGGAIYGEKVGRKFNEDDTVDPQSPYGMSKSSFEKYLTYYSDKFNLPSTVIRPSNVFGPGQNPYGEAGVVSIFGKKMLENEPVTIFGTGDEYRDYIYIDDVVDFIEKIIEENITGTYNLCSGQKTKTIDIFNSLKEIVDYKDEPVMSNSREGDILGIELDNSKALGISNWKPKTSLQEGLNKTISHLKNS